MNETSYSKLCERLRFKLLINKLLNSLRIISTTICKKSASPVFTNFSEIQEN